MKFLATASLLALGSIASAEALIVVSDALLLPPVNYVVDGESVVFQNASSSELTIASSGDSGEAWTTGAIAPGGTMTVAIKQGIQLNFAVVGDESARQGSLTFDPAPKEATPGE